MLLRAMSSCLAITSRSRERPPSGGGVAPAAEGGVAPAAGLGVSCAATVRAAKTVVNANDKIAGTQRAPAQSGFFIACLFLSGPRCSGALFDQTGKAELKPEAVRESGREDRRGGGSLLPLPKAAAATPERLKVPQRNRLG